MLSQRTKILLFWLILCLTAFVAERLLSKKIENPNEVQKKAEPPPFSYDPSACPSGDGEYVYFAFRNTVLRFYYKQSIDIRDAPDEMKAGDPLPLSSKAPEGCYEHPIQAVGIKLTYWDEALIRKRDPSLLKGRPNQLGYYRNTGDKIQYERNGEQMFDRLKKNKNFTCEKMDWHFTTCYSPNFPGPKSERDGYYKMDESVYTTPYGFPFVVHCWDGNRCEVKYKIADELNVSYSFSPKNIPLSAIVDVDKEIRLKTSQAIIANYQWGQRVHP